MKIANPNPVRCASCFGAYPQRVHVDFESYWDGPVVNEGTGEVPIPIPIDDLVICEDCMVAAAELLGFVRDDDLRAENFELGKNIDERDKEIARLNKEVVDLMYTVKQLYEHPPQRQAGRPKVRLPDKERVAA